jgi:hypothetical protein
MDLPFNLCILQYQVLRTRNVMSQRALNGGDQCRLPTAATPSLLC